MASNFDVSVLSDSDDDAKYVSTGEEALSESSGGENVSEDEHANGQPKLAKKNKLVKKQKGETKKDVIREIDSKELKVDPKKHADDVLKSFFNDVDKTQPAVDTVPGKDECKDSKVPVENVFEFAGETITVVNDSNQGCHNCSLSNVNTSMSATGSEIKVLPKKRGGIDSVLGTLMKKQKMTTLQKTLYDWKTLKKSEGIEDLEKFNKGRGGRTYIHLHFKAIPTKLSVTKVILPPQPPPPAVKLFTYPPQIGGIAVTNEDLACLNEGEFLNDVIIDFFLKYVFCEKLSRVNREKSHIFSTFFYSSLTGKIVGDDPTKTAQFKRHNHVKTWTKHVDIFSKDYIIIPINMNFHWFLAIICFPNRVPEAPSAPDTDSVTSTDEQEHVEISSNGEDNSPNQDESSMNSSLNSPDGKQRKEMPCICIFDSLAHYDGINRCLIVNTLREYLEMEWKSKKGTRKIFDKNTMQGFIMNCPQQTNFSDCGLYLLQFVESFFENPIPFANPMPDLTNWFTEGKINRKRQELKDLILSLQKNYCEAL